MSDQLQRRPLTLHGECSDGAQHKIEGPIPAGAFDNWARAKTIWSGDEVRAIREAASLSRPALVRRQGTLHQQCGIDCAVHSTKLVRAHTSVQARLLAAENLQRSLSVLKPSGKLISISGPPDMAFAREQGLNWFLQQVMRLLSFGIRRKAKGRRISYSFLFMRAERRAVEDRVAGSTCHLRLREDRRWRLLSSQAVVHTPGAATATRIRR